MKLKRILCSILAIALVLSTMGTAVFATDGSVAKVGNTEYATIDAAIAAWTNGTTLTLLSDVTLSDVIKLKSTESHTLNLGTYTMTAASGKHAIEITCEGRSSASYALTVNADATNPGGITATGKSCIYYSKSSTTKDRPIIRIYNGIYNGSYSINCKSNGNTNCPQIWIYGGTFNSNVNLTKCMLRVFGGTFNGWINCTGDSSAYREISGGTFKQWQFMTADADSKFWVGTSKANYDVGLYVDNNGYLVVGGAPVTEAGDTFEASSANYGGWSSYLKYSSAATNSLYYTSVKEALADNNKSTGSVTVYADEINMTGISYKGTIVVPEGQKLKITNAPANLKVVDTAGKDLVVGKDGAYGPKPAWEGEGTEVTPYVINDIDGLKAFQESVNSGETHENVYFKLENDIDLKADAVSLMSAEVTPNWTPIGTCENPFKGTFDGDGHTIYNLVVKGGANQGYFGYADNAIIKNVNIVNATVIGTDCVGAVAGQVYSTSTIDNCHVSGNIQITGQTNVGGIVGKYYTKVTNSSVIGDGASTSFVKGEYYAADLEGDNVGGIMGHCGENNNLSGNTVKDITVSGTRKVGGIVGVADQNTDVANCVVENVVVETTATKDYAEANITKMSIGGLIGQYQAAGSTVDGTVKGSTVSNVTFVIPEGIVCEAGAVTGGARGGKDGMLPPSDKIVVEGNTVTDVTGATNDYFVPVKPVAKIGDTEYKTLEEAFKAATANCVIEILDDVTIDYYWDSRYTGAKFMNPVTINGNGHKLTFTAEVYDGGNHYSVFRFENDATVKNLTIDMTNAISMFSGRFRAISAKGNLTVDGCTFIGNGSGNNTRAIIFGEGAGANAANLVISITNSTFNSWRRAISDNENAQDVKSVTVTGNTMNDASVYVSANEEVVFNNNTVTDAYVNIKSYTANNTLNVTATGNTLTENTDSVYNEIDAGGTVDAQDGFVLPWDGVTITNLEELIMFRDAVNAGDSYKGKTVTLTADIDLAGENWIPIGSINNDHGFMGNFDGKGHTIYNLTINNPEIDSDGYAYAGLFGITEGVENNQNYIKDLTIENVTINTTGQIVAAAIAYPYYTEVENIKVCGEISISGGDYTAGVLAYTRRCINASNLTVEGATGSTISGKQVVGGVISDIQMNGGLTANYSNFNVSGVTISGTKSVGGISGIISAQTLTGASVKDVTLSCDDPRVGIVSGSLGSASVISNVVIENVTGASGIVGADYKTGKVVEAKIGDKYYATLEDALNAAQAGDTVTIMEGTYSVPSMKAGITVVGEGNVLLEGTLSGTLENLTLKNLHIKGGNAQRWAYAKGDCVFENVTFEATSVYALHFDGITEGTTLLYKDCTIIGWAAMGGSPASCVFDGCTIKDNGTYGVIRTYFDADIKDCTFDVDGANTEDGYEDGIHAVDGAIVNVDNCTNVNGDIKEVLNASDSYIYVDGVLVLGPAVAKIGDTEYSSLADAAANANAGDTIVMVDDVTFEGPVELPAGITLNGNGFTINGSVKAGGDLTFEGKTTIHTFSAGWYNNTITIGEGASLEITGGRMTVSYGNTFNIKGNVENAKTANKESIKPSLKVTSGLSFNGDGAGTSFNVENAYVIIGDSTTKNNGATGEFNINFTNSIVDFTKTLKTYEPTADGLNPVVNLNCKDSVVSFASHLELWRTGTNMTLDNTDLTVGGSFANAGTVNVINGANFVVKAPIMSSHGGNTGTIFIDGAVMNLIDSNQDWENAGTFKITADGKLIANDFACVNNGVIIIDAKDLAAGTSATVVENTTGDSSLEGKVTVENGENVKISYDEKGSVTIEKAEEEPNFLEKSLFVTYSKLSTFDFGDGNGEVPAIKLTLLAGINSLQYKEVGFDVTLGDVTKPFATTKVYDQVKTIYNGKETWFKAEDFGKNSKYVFGQNIFFPATADFEDVTVLWMPYAKKLNGDKVEGTKFKLNDLFPGTLEVNE